MKRIILLIAITAISMSVHSQTISFLTNENWTSLKEKAKKEHKYIFIDVYATYCGPCKLMDSVVYRNDTVAKYFNENFISAKLQIDKTLHDTETIKMMYEDAAMMKAKYQIQVVPSFLFFDYNGEIVTKSSGYKDSKELVNLGKIAKDPNNAYLTLIKEYDQNKLVMSCLPALVQKAEKIGEFDLANSIAQDYINNYLLKLKETDIQTKENLSFLGKYIGTPKTKAFEYFSKHAVAINSVLGKDKAEYKIKSAITAEYFPTEDKWPNNIKSWDSLIVMLNKKFGVLGLEVANANRMLCSFYKKDWVNSGKYYKLYLQTALKRPDYNINNISWEIFQYVEDKEILEYACDVVMKYAMEEWYQSDPVSWDTYANLLYKVGRTTQAIEWEEKAVKMKMGQSDEKLYTDALDKMKKNLPTWVVAGSKPNEQ